MPLSTVPNGLDVGFPYMLTNILIGQPQKQSNEANEKFPQ